MAVDVVGVVASESPSGFVRMGIRYPLFRPLKQLIIGFGAVVEDDLQSVSRPGRRCGRADEDR